MLLPHEKRIRTGGPYRGCVSGPAGTAGAMGIGEIIGLIIVGLIIGALGRLLHPGRDPMGLLMTIGIGIVSMFVAGLLLHGALGAIGSFVVAVIIAVILVALTARFMGGRGTARRAF